MVVRIHNVSKWLTVPAGEILYLKGDGPRRVRIELNAAAPCRADVVVLDQAQRETKTLLGVFQGLETYEFWVDGTAHLILTTDEDVAYFTNDGGQIAEDRPELVSFTSIMNRRARNPQQELMMFKMQQNINRRLDALAAENERLRADIEKVPPHDPETGEIKDGEIGAAASAGTAGEAPSGDAAAASAPDKGEGGSAKPAAVVPA